MEDIDFSELKMSAGRPAEETIKQVDLKSYLVDAEFSRRFKSFYVPWEEIIKAKVGQRKKYIDNMEEFYGEVLEKFSGLSTNRQKAVLMNVTPLNLLYSLTNLSNPNVFHNKEDNKYFLEEMKTTRLLIKQIV